MSGAISSPQRAIAVTLSPRHLSHVLIAGIIILVAMYAGKRADAALTPEGWTFEPFSHGTALDGTAGWLHGHAEVDASESTTLPVENVPRERVVSYVVQAGDSLSVIARAYGLAIDSVMWANGLEDPDFLEPGSRLRIPPGNGVLHTVTAGETLTSIGTRYGVENWRIEGHPFNSLGEPDVLAVGRVILVPDGRPPRPVAEVAAPKPVVLPAPQAPSGRAVSGPTPAPAPAPVVALPGGGRLGWPTAGSVSQGFSGSHLANDIAAPYGSPVFASGDGVVFTAAEGWNGGYGTLVEIDHGNGIVTRYAHLSTMAVSAGQKVARGQVIGRVGTTGITTGPHVHFEVLSGGTRVNPASYLR